MNDILEIMSKAIVDCCDFPNAAAEDALTALTAAGYVVVPVTPTSEMKGAGHKALEEHTGRIEHCPVMENVYAAMIAAVPQAGEG